MTRKPLIGAVPMQAQQAAPAPVQPSRIPPVPAEMMKDPKYGNAAQIMALPPAGLAALLQDPAATVYARAKACQRLAVVGDKSAVPALASLLGDAQLSLYSRMALETLPDRAADEALRAALGKVQGRQLAGVINSIGKRRDTSAIPALEKLRHHENPDIAASADAALARIRPVL